MDRRIPPLNFFAPAKLANSFKWRLIERAFDRDLADKLTGTLVLQLSLRLQPTMTAEALHIAPNPGEVQRLLSRTNKPTADCAYERDARRRIAYVERLR
jgi:hypothetical protein